MSYFAKRKVKESGADIAETYNSTWKQLFIVTGQLEEKHKEDSLHFRLIGVLHMYYGNRAVHLASCLS